MKNVVHCHLIYNVNGKMKKDYEGPLYAPWWKVVAGRKNRPKVNDSDGSVLDDTETNKK